MRDITGIFLTAAALTAALPLAAQPSGPGVTAGSAAYRSAFDGYRPFEAGEVQDWRKSNDTVREVGGWRAYAREIQGGAQSPTQPGAAAGPAHGHDGHSAPQAQPVNPHQGHQR